MTTPIPTARRYVAFTHDPGGGNPAGVVVSDTLPDEAVMQSVAADVGYSETAFVAPRGDPGETREYDVRYFSPEAEVPFCGHATIATGVALADGDPSLEQVVLHSRTDRIPVAVSRSGGLTTATLTSPPTSHTTPTEQLLDEALDGFGWDRGALAGDLAPAVASAGATHLVLPLATRELLAAMDYDFPAVRALMLREDWTTIDLVWRESPTRFHARNAFAVGGVVEDPATGAAAAALGGYLRDSGELAPPFTLTVLQGHDMGRPSTLRVDAAVGAPGIDVTGSAVPIPA